MKNLKTTLVSLAAISAAALASYAQEQQAPAAPAAAPEAPAVEAAAPAAEATAEAAAPAAQSNAKSSKVKTKYGEIEVSSTTLEGGSEKVSVQTPALPKTFSTPDLINTLVACALSVVENVSAQDVLKAFAAAMATSDLSPAAGAEVSLVTTIPTAGNSTVELNSPSANFVFAPESVEKGQVKGSIVATDARGNSTQTSVDVAVSDSGVSGKVGGSNVSVSSASVAVSQPEAQGAEVPTAAEATSAAESVSNDTVGDGKGISPEA